MVSLMQDNWSVITLSCQFVSVVYDIVEDIEERDKARQCRGMIHMQACDKTNKPYKPERIYLHSNHLQYKMLKSPI